MPIKNKQFTTAIVYPKARYLCHDGYWMLFHSEVHPNDDNLRQKRHKRRPPPYWTDNCSKIDESGFCRGHKMTREEFLNYVRLRGWDK